MVSSSEEDCKPQQPDHKRQKTSASGRVQGSSGPPKISSIDGSFFTKISEKPKSELVLAVDELRLDGVYKADVLHRRLKDASTATSSIKVAAFDLDGTLV